MASNTPDDFGFNLIGTYKTPFVGYISSEDPTRTSPQALVRGSQNTILKDTGNIENRPGKKRYDPADNTQDPVVSSFDWNDVDGNTLLVRVLESGKLQFYHTPDETWYLLGTYTGTDFSFAKWWSTYELKEYLVMVHGTTDLLMWSGAMTDGVGAVNESNSILLSETGPVEDLSFSYFNLDGEISTSVDWNQTIGYAGIVLNENPPNGSILGITFTSTAPFPSTTGYIQFVDALTSPVDDEYCQILIGATKEATTANLLGIFTAPSSNTATQKGFVDADVISAFQLLDSYEIVPSLESANDTTWNENGFVNGGNIIVNGVEYTYTLVADRWLINISGTPPEDTFAYAGIVVTENTPSSDFTNDFVLVLNNQLIVCSYTSRIVYISSNQDDTGTGYTDFVNSGDLVDGDPDFAVLDEFPLGGTTRGDSAYIGAGVSSWYELTPNTPIQYVASVNPATVATKVTKFTGAGLTAPKGFNFVTTWGEDIVYLGQDNQLRTLGFYRNINVQKSPSLSIAVRDELKSIDFTGGCVRAIDEYIYIVSPVTGKTYLYEIKDDVDEVGNITSRRNWQPPQTWNISRMSIVDGIVHGYSAENPQLYQLFETDQWRDDTGVEDVFSPYISVARFAYKQIGERNKLGVFDKVFYEGYIAPFSDLQANVYYDYRGATFLSAKVLSDGTNTPVLYGGDGITLIGGALIGNTTIGGGRRDIDYSNGLPKFRAITNVDKNNCFEYQIELVSEQLDSQWTLIATGANEQLVTDNPVNIQLTY